MKDKEKVVKKPKKKRKSKFIENLQKLGGKL